MNIRCKSCQSTIWLESTDTHDQPTLGRCRKCGQHYRLAAPRRLRSAERRLGRSARELARKHGIDLSGAYSVLLGVMDVEEVQELGHAASVACRTGATPTPAPGADDQAYDPAFQPAIDGGFLTSRQAIERGQRESYASILIRRHQISAAAARAVADNRISLLEAVRRRGAGKEEVEARVRSGLRQPLKWAGAVALPMVVVVALAGGTGVDRPVGATVSLALGSERILHDALGRVVLVQGATPRGVLRDFCRAGNPGGVFEPLSILPVVAGDARVRLGLLRDPADPSDVLSIRIREDRAADRWVTGDGSEPVVPAPAPPMAAAAADG